MRHYTNTDNPVDFPKSALRHTKGNLLDLAEAGEFDVVVQGCNCFNTMGGGIAREIRDRYPVAHAADAATTRGDYNKLGTWSVGLNDLTDRRFLIINAYTQYEMSRGTDVFEYVAFNLILQKLLHAYGDKQIGFPYIGCGLAGGDSDYIIQQIEMFANQVSEKGGSVTLVEFGG